MTTHLSTGSYLRDTDNRVVLIDGLLNQKTVRFGLSAQDCGGKIITAAKSKTILVTQHYNINL